MSLEEAGYSLGEGFREMASVRKEQLTCHVYTYQILISLENLL